MPNFLKHLKVKLNFFKLKTKFFNLLVLQVVIKPPWPDGPAKVSIGPSFTARQNGQSVLRKISFFFRAINITFKVLLETINFNLHWIILQVYKKKKWLTFFFFKFLKPNKNNFNFYSLKVKNFQKIQCFKICLIFS